MIRGRGGGGGGEGEKTEPLCGASDLLKRIPPKINKQNIKKEINKYKE